MRNTYWVLVGLNEGKRNLEDLGIDGAIILKCFLKIVWECADCIRLAEYENPQRAFAEMTRNCRVP